MKIELSVTINGKKYGVMTTSSGGNLEISDSDNFSITLEACKQAILKRINEQPSDVLETIEVINN